MRRLFAMAVACTSCFVLGLYLRGRTPTALAVGGGGAGGGAPTCSSRNADVNADEKVDLSDAVTVLNFLFLGNPTELAPHCDPPELTARIQDLEAQLADCRAGNCPGSRAGLPDTGQAACYSVDEDQDRFEVPCSTAACAGQDGSYATGCPGEGRFTDNGDRTVTDNCTGLQWQKDTADLNGDGQSTDQDHAHWCEALTYCENLSFAGHDDWRLPNVRELQSIVDYGRRDPAIDPVFGPVFSDASVAPYWSSTSCAGCLSLGSADFEWGVDFFRGSVFIESGDAIDDPAYVRAVRNAR